MRQKGQSASLAERLNNAMAQLHAQKIAFQTERTELHSQLERLKQEIEKLRTKYKQLKRTNRQNQYEGNHQGYDNNGESEQIVMKIQNYLSRVQQSSKQMAQVASQCRVFDVQIEKASSQIQKNIIKSLGGLQKYVQELVKQWCQRQTLRLQNQRLQKQNKYLFQLTTKLQQNFKQTDRILKHLQRGQIKQDKYIQQVKVRIPKQQDQAVQKNNQTRKQAITDLQSKITRLSEKVRSLEQQNSTIKSIHQRTMKKLQKLQQSNRQRDQDPIDGQGIQEERKKWLEKTQEMYDQIRRLNKQLLISQQSEKKVREQLAGCLQIYGQWEKERQGRKAQIQQLKTGIETYIKKIQQLQMIISQNKGQIQALCQRLQVSQGQKQKIVSVYQLQVQQLNDDLFKKQDAIIEMESIINKQHLKHQQLKKQQLDLNKLYNNLQQAYKKVNSDIVQLKHLINQQEYQCIQLKEQLKAADLQKKQLLQNLQRQRKEMLITVQRQKFQRQQLAEIMNQFKEQYYTSRKELTTLQEEIQTMKQGQFSIKQQLRNIIGIADDTIDIWILLGNIRELIKNIVSQNKNLKEYQKTLIYQYQNKNSQATAQIQQISEQYEDLKQYTQSEKKNEQVSFKIYKMKVLQKNICNEKIIEKAKNIKELIQIITSSIKGNDNQPQYDQGQHQHQQIVSKLNQQIIMLQEHQKILKNQLNVEIANNRKIQAQCQILKKIEEESEKQYTQLLQDLQQQRNQKQQLQDELQQLKKQSNTKNQEMSELFSDLNKIQNQLYQFKDEKSSIQSKLDHARKILIQNQQLQTEIQNLKNQIQQIHQNYHHQNTQSIRQIDNLKAKILSFHIKKQQLTQHTLNYQQIQIMPSQKEDKNEIEIQKSYHNDEYLVQIKDLLQQIQQKNHKIYELQQSVILLDENNKLLLMKIGKIEQDLKTINQQLNQYKAICNHIQNQKEYFSVLKQELLSKINKDDQKSKQQIDQQNLQYINLTLQIDAKMNQIEQLQKLLESKDSKINQLQMYKSQLQSKLAYVNKENAERSDFIIKEQQIKIAFNKIYQKEKQLMAKMQQTNQKQDKLNQRQTEIIKKLQQLKAFDNKQMQTCQKSHLGMDSMRQSLNIINNPINYKQESITQKLREQLDFAKKIIIEKQTICHLKESQIESLIEKCNNKQQQIKDNRKQCEQIEEEMNEYKQYCENLKQQVMALQKYRQSTNKDKQQLQANIQEIHDLIHRGQEDHVTITKLQQDIACLSNKLYQNESIAKQNDKKLKQYQQLLQSSQKQNREKQYVISKYKLQNQRSSKELITIKLLIDKKDQQIKEITNKNIEYIQRLNQIEDIMEIVKKDQAESQILKIKLEQKEQQNNQLQQSMLSMEQNYRITANHFTIFEKRNKEMSEQISTLKIQLDKSRQQIQKYIKQQQKSKENLLQTKEILSNYVKLGKLQQINKLLIDQERIKRQLKGLYQQKMESERLSNINKLKLQQLQRLLNKKNDQISSKENEILRQKEQNSRIKQIIKNNNFKNDQNQQLVAKIQKLKQQIQQSRQELLERQNKITQIKQNASKIETQKQLLEENLKQQQKAYELLKLQIDHYKQQVKRISKEKVLAKSQAIKSRCSFQEQNTIFKQKESQMQEEIKKSNSQKQEIIKQLKQQVSRLKENNSLLFEQSSVQFGNTISRRTSQASRQKKMQEYNDMPLQLPSRNRQKSVQNQQKVQKQQISKHQYDLVERYRQILQDQNKYLKSQLIKNDKANSKIKQIEKNNIVLSSEVEALQRQLKAKTFNLDNLQKQFKNKIEDYSKLQRIVESLKDQLNLQRKRVKNFQDLYQSIQDKRIKISNNIKNQTE